MATLSGVLGLGFWEIAIILIAALLALGPEKLPKAAGQMGLLVRKWRRMLAQLNFELTEQAQQEKTKPPPEFVAKQLACQPASDQNLSDQSPYSACGAAQKTSVESADRAQQ